MSDVCLKMKLCIDRNQNKIYYAVGGSKIYTGCRSLRMQMFKYGPDLFTGKYVLVGPKEKLP